MLSATLALLGVAGLSACGQSGERRGEAVFLTGPGHGAARTIPPARKGALAIPPARKGASALPRVPRYFAPARERSLAELARAEHARSGGRLDRVTSTYVPGTRRVAFGVIAPGGSVLYGPTALYVADTAGGPARGPYMASADSLRVPAAYRATDQDDDGGLRAIYHAQVPFPRAGSYQVLALTRTRKHTLAAFTRIVVAASSPIPDVGQRAPSVATPTPASVGGDVSLLTTRVPPESMHALSLDAVLGRRPVALLFSSPAFCGSQACDAVTDVAVYVQHEFGGRVVFIHSELYRDNDPAGPMQPALTAFHLHSEPWLFTVDRRGRIAARLEGTFGVEEFRAAVRAALR